MKRHRLVGKERCPECCDLPGGEVVSGHDHTNNYHLFVLDCRNASFTDEQINVLADWLDITDGEEYKTPQA